MKFFWIHSLVLFFFRDLPLNCAQLSHNKFLYFHFFCHIVRHHYFISNKTLCHHILWFWQNFFSIKRYAQKMSRFFSSVWLVILRFGYFQWLSNKNLIGLHRRYNLLVHRFETAACICHISVSHGDQFYFFGVTFIDERRWILETRKKCCPQRFYYMYTMSQINSLKIPCEPKK